MGIRMESVLYARLGKVHWDYKIHVLTVLKAVLVAHQAVAQQFA